MSKAICSGTVNLFDFCCSGAIKTILDLQLKRSFLVVWISSRFVAESARTRVLGFAKRRRCTGVLDAGARGSDLRDASILRRPRLRLFLLATARLAAPLRNYQSDDHDQQQQHESADADSNVQAQIASLAVAHVDESLRRVHNGRVCERACLISRRCGTRS
jgi:hypothetical protein